MTANAAQGAVPTASMGGAGFMAALGRFWNPASARIATKTVLAAGLAVGGALYLNWQVTPALITVQMLQAATLGLSVRNSCTRFLAACFAGVISLVLLMLFPQDRFLLVLGYGAWATFAVYRMAGSQNPYFWLISLFVVPFVAMATGGNPHATFNQAVSIASSFGLGGAAVIVVNAALWPNLDRLALESGIEKSLQAIRDLFTLNRITQPTGAETGADRQQLQAELLKSAAGLPDVLAQAAVESPQIDDFKANYTHFINDMVMLGSEVITLGDLLEECMRSEGLQGVLTRSDSLNAGIAQFEAELSRLADQPTQPRDGSLVIEVNDCPELAGDIDQSGLGAMDRAALQALLYQADSVWSAITQARNALARLEDPAHRLPALDPDYKEPFSFTSHRFTWALTVGLSAILATYLWLLTDWPGGLKLAILVPVLGASLFAKPTPGVPALVLIGMTIVLCMTWIMYFVVLPILPNSFLFLYPVLLLFMFPIVYCQALPIPIIALPGFAGGLVFCMTSNIAHPQEISFPLYIDGAIGLATAVVFLLGYFSFMTWNRPEQEFRQRVAAFLEICRKTLQEFETITPENGQSALRGRRKTLIAAYQQCATVAARLPYERLPEGTRQGVDTFVDALWFLTFRMDAVLRARARQIAEGSEQPLRGSALRGAMAAQLNALAQATADAGTPLDLSTELVLEENAAYVQALQRAVVDGEHHASAAAQLMVLAGLHQTLATAIHALVGQHKAMALPDWNISRF